MGSILVTGGAGYIGSHIVRCLVERDEQVLVVDDLSEGHRAAVGQVPLIVSDFADPEMLDRELGDGAVEFIVHMAAVCEVGTSMKDPSGYYENNPNTLSGLDLLLPETRLQSIVDRLSIPFFAMGSHFVETGMTPEDIKALYHGGSGHLTIEGHRYYGATLAESGFLN